LGADCPQNIWLAADHDAIEVEQELAKPHEAGEVRGVLTFSHGLLRVGGSHMHNSWYMAFRAGSDDQIVQPDVEGGKTYGLRLDTRSERGWMADIDRQTKARAALCVRFITISTECTPAGNRPSGFWTRASVAPGKTFTTRYTIKPVKGF